MNRQYYTLNYHHSTVTEISYYLISLGLTSQQDYGIEYESHLNEFRIWLNDEKFLTMIYLKFGGKQ